MAKKKAKTIRFLIFPDGEKREITGETGKYWICGDAQFRKTRGLEIVEEKAEEKTDAESGKERGC